MKNKTHSRVLGFDPKSYIRLSAIALKNFSFEEQVFILEESFAHICCIGQQPLQLGLRLHSIKYNNVVYLAFFPITTLRVHTNFSITCKAHIRGACLAHNEAHLSRVG